MLTGSRRPKTRRSAISKDFVAMWAVALIGAGALRNVEAADFERFIGGIPPVVAVAVTGAVGSAALVVLDAAGWVGSDPTRRGIRRSTGLALVLGAAMIVADTALGFGEEINVGWPASILFYPVMAFVAEVAFHLAPLALVVTASRRWDRLSAGSAAVAVPVATVALFEAVYQVLGSGGPGISPWLLAYLAIHMCVFAAAGLVSLRNYGFWAMMWLRLAYYAIWHVAWGVLRLELLF